MNNTDTNNTSKGRLQGGEIVPSFSIKDYYYQVLLNKLVDPKHSVLFDILVKDLSVHPNQVLNKLGYITDEQYIEIMSSKGLILTRCKELIDEGLFKLPPVTQMLLSNVVDYEGIMLQLDSLIKDGMCLLGYYNKSGNTNTLLWAFREPDASIIQEGVILHNNTFNKQDRLELLSNITRALSGTQIDALVVTQTEFKDICDRYYEVNSLPSKSTPLWEMDFTYLAQKLVLDGLVRGASEIYFNGALGGIEYGYSILGDYSYEGLISATASQQITFSTAIYVMAGINRADNTSVIVRNYEVQDLGKLGEYKGRMNILPCGYPLEAINIRVIPKAVSIIPIDKLNIRPGIKDVLKDQLRLNSDGIWLLSGQTGSGKSTTIRSLMTYLREVKPTHRIESIEAPIEADINGISQIGVDENSHIKIGDILTALTRRNPKIVNLNEINTKELLKFAVNSSLMQLFVMSSIHASSVASIPDRVLGFTYDQPEIFRQFLQVVKGMAHQTMFKEICPDCREVVPITDQRITTSMTNVLTSYGYLPSHNTITITKHNPDCPKCKGLGRLIHKPVVCMEYLTVDTNTKNLLMSTPIERLEIILKRLLIDKGTSGVHDALKYVDAGILSWFDVWSQFSLINDVGILLKSDKDTNDGGH